MFGEQNNNNQHEIVGVCFVGMKFLKYRMPDKLAASS